jgi:hypothetical protein
VTKLDQHLLSNRAFGGRDVHDDYVRQAFPHLHSLVDKIDAAMWSRLRPAQPDAAKVKSRSRRRGRGTTTRARDQSDAPRA